MFYNGWTYDLQKGPEGAYSFEPLADERKHGANIQALFKINGAWQPAEDWTDRPFGFFCRDWQAERIEELALIVSNSEWQDREHVLERAGEAPRLVVSNIGCHKWEGMITYKSDAKDKDWPSFNQTSMVTQGVWIAIPRPPDGTDPTGYLFAAYAFEPVGEVSVEEVYERYVQGSNGPVVECGGTAHGKTTLSGEGYLRMGVALFHDDPLARYYDAEGTTQIEIILPACENGNETREFPFLRLPENARFTVEPNGILIRGSWSQDCSDDLATCSESYIWELNARREQ